MNLLNVRNHLLFAFFTFAFAVIVHEPLYSGLKITLSVQRETRSYLQLLYIIGKLSYRRFTVPLVRSLGYCAERIQGNFLHAVIYGCKYIDLPTVSLLLLSELLHNNNKYLSISFTAHLGGRQCAEELLSAL